MCQSLMLSQFLRLLKSSDVKTVAHIDYWIGDTLTDLLPSLDKGRHADDIHDYYCFLESLVVNGKIDGLLNPCSWRSTTNKDIYKQHAKGFPVPKMQRDADGSLNYNQAWKRINLPVLPSSIRDIAYLLLHNKLPTRERLFSVGLMSDPYCTFCPAAIICDVEHYFCACDRVSRIWTRIKNILLSMVDTSITDWCLINFFMEKSGYENEIVWLIGNYIAKVWSELHVRNKEELKDKEFFGFLTYKFKEDQQGSRWKMQDIPGLI